MLDIPKPSIVTVKGSPFKSSSIAEFEKEYRWKVARVVLFSFLTLATAAAVGWTLNYAFKTATPRAWLYWAVAFLLWLGMLAISSLILSWKLNIALGISSAGLLLFPYWQIFSPLILAGLGVFTGLGFFVAGAEMRQKHGLVLRVEMRNITKAGLPLVVFTLSLLFAAVYYLHLDARSAQGEFLVREESIQSTLRVSANLWKPMIPGFHENITIGELLSSLSMDTTQNALEEFFKKNPSVKNLPQTELNRIQLQISQEAQKTALSNLSERLGVTLTGKEPVSQVLYNYFADWYKRLPQQAQKTFVVAWAVLVFLAIWSFGYLVIIFGPIAAWLLYQLFRSVNLVKVNRIPAEKEILSL